MWKCPPNKSGDMVDRDVAAVFVLLVQAYPPPGVDPVCSCVDAVGFLAVASVACGDEVGWVGCAAEVCWDYVVDGVGFGSAVCAGVCVALEYGEAELFPVCGF